MQETSKKKTRFTVDSHTPGEISRREQIKKKFIVQFINFLGSDALTVPWKYLCSQPVALVFLTHWVVPLGPKLCHLRKGLRVPAVVAPLVYITTQHNPFSGVPSDGDTVGSHLVPAQGNERSADGPKLKHLTVGGHPGHLFRRSGEDDRHLHSSSAPLLSGFFLTQPSL